MTAVLTFRSAPFSAVIVGFLAAQTWDSRPSTSMTAWVLTQSGLTAPTSCFR